MAKKVLVVGGSGFLGSHVADELTERGYEVTIFDQKKSTWINDNQKFIESDLLDREHVIKSLEDLTLSFILLVSQILENQKKNRLKLSKQILLEQQIFLKDVEKIKLKNLFLLHLSMYSANMVPFMENQNRPVNY